MVVILKRFLMDDVPLAAFDCDLETGVTMARGMIATFTGRRRFATKTDQRIVHADIGSELCSLLVCGFNKEGRANRSVIVNPDGTVSDTGVLEKVRK